jgi:enamine deaminase RidA (YjgF/YER057c/UK114 family)
MSDWEKRIADLGVQIPDPLPAGGLYTPVVIDGKTAYTSGIVAIETNPVRLAYPGCLGADLSVEDGQASARGAMISTLANLRGVLGDLNRIERFLKVTGFVRAAPDFKELPKVLDGASQLLIDIFGDDRRTARTTVGVAALPGGASVEIDTVLALKAAPRRRSATGGSSPR